MFFSTWMSPAIKPHLSVPVTKHAEMSTASRNATSVALTTGKSVSKENVLTNVHTWTAKTVSMEHACTKNLTDLALQTMTASIESFLA